MTKYYGLIGFSSQTLSAPGVWENTIEEKRFVGDILKHAVGNTDVEGVNDDVNLNMRVSIVFDGFLSQNYSNIVYVTVNDVKWRVSNIELNYPRVILSLSGVYNG